MPTRRKSNSWRVLEGQAPRISPVVPELSANPRAPSWLPKEAKTEWRRILELCSRYDKWLQAVDRAALAAYCMAWSTFEVAARDVAQRGPLVPARSSADQAAQDLALVKNPAVQVMRDSGVAMRMWCKELGFTPDSRGRIDLGRLDDGVEDSVFNV